MNMYNALIKISEELKQDTTVKSCLKCMEEVHDKADNLKWHGYFAQARKLVDNAKEILIDKCPIYRQYILCCLLLDQYGFGNFNTNYNTEVANFIKRYYSNKISEVK